GRGVIGFLVGEAARDLARAGRVALAAVALIALSLGSVGAFWLLSTNLGAARYVSKAEALNRLKRGLGARAAAADVLPENPLPASIEVTPAAGAGTPEATRALLASLSAMPEIDDVHGGTGWVERAAHWQRLLQVIGIGVGLLLGLAAVVTITTATTLALHARREEIEIMRLVGASEAV